MTKIAYASRRMDQEEYLSYEEILLTLPALGQVRSDQNVVLSSKLSSRITSMVKSGNMVTKGQVVVTLDHEKLLAKKEANPADRLS